MSASSGLAVMDLHCHVDLYPDPAAVVAEAEALGIRTIAVTNAPSVFGFTRKLVAGCRYVRAAVGLHPQLVATHGHELQLLWPLLEETRYVGEVGLDYMSAIGTERARQREVFSAIVKQCADAGDKVLSVHSRRAASDVIAVLGAGFPGKVILHWFSGTARELDRAVGAGMYFSVNVPMLVSERGSRLVAAIPRDRVLVETDGPFVKTGSRPTTPMDAGIPVTALAQLWGGGAASVRGTLLSNLRTLLGDVAESPRRTR
jgi:TatD DNase family protein